MRKDYTKKIQQEEEIEFLKNKLSGMSSIEKKAYIRGYFDKLKHEAAIYSGIGSSKKFSTIEFGYYLISRHILTGYLLEVMKKFNMRNEVKEILKGREKCRKSIDKFIDEVTKSLGEELKLPTPEQSQKFHELDDIF